MKLITLTSDFAVQSQSVGVMEAIVFSISPDSKLIHLMHGLPSYDIIASARTMEAICHLPVGKHVCVCDPSVGTLRKGIVIKVGRGDYLIGPDNGVLIPATHLLGGIIKVHEIKNETYMRTPVSPIFHGRDVFAPVAAYLANGIEIEKIGPGVSAENLNPPPYLEATMSDNRVMATVIQINKFGSLHLNILQTKWDFWGLNLVDQILFYHAENSPVKLEVCDTFGDVAEESCLILKDDYGRIEIAINKGSFAERFQISIGDRVKLVVPRN